MPRVVSQYARVEVWRSLEVLTKAVEAGAADCSAFDEYREDAVHEYGAYKEGVQDCRDGP